MMICENSLLAGKRLLLFPGSAVMVKVVDIAKKMGLYTIVIDYYADWDKAPAKRVADEAYDISFNDIDLLEQFCKEKHIDGVFSGFSEFSIMAAAKLCKRIGKPFYATPEQLEIMSDKKKFKELCRKNGVKVVEEYKIDLKDIEGSAKIIRYPVCVKPVDNAGSRGITVAYDIDSLKTSIDYALSYSESKQVVVEQYMTGQESCLTYSLQNGRIVLSTMSDAQLSSTEKGHLNLPYAWIYPSKNYNRCLEEVNDKIINMFHSIGMHDGCCFVNCFAEKDGLYFFEAGFRVGGGMNFLLQEKKYGKNFVELSIAYSILGDSSILYNLDFDDFRVFSPCGNLVIVLKEGTISKYIGFEKLRDIDGIIDVGVLKPIGTVIKNVGDYSQNLCRIIIMSKSANDFANIIDEIYRTIEVLDENGESMLLGQLDTDIVRHYWRTK